MDIEQIPVSWIFKKRLVSVCLLLPVVCLFNIIKHVFCFYFRCRYRRVNCFAIVIVNFLFGVVVGMCQFVFILILYRFLCVLLFDVPHTSPVS